MNLDNAPESVKKQYEELVKLMDKNPKSYSVPATDAAKVLGMDVECLKAAAYQGRCPFAIGGDNGALTNRFTKIPKLALWNFFNQTYTFK
ncbi:hypothetical protein [Acetobacterium woodii]|uniref:hypothetical protein n=1 Tax=Acetobacterium woodii TaxID=33952 RepID=UPI0002F247A1|nr:hypothetical protein [Acetobacterium woodii]